MRRRSSCSKRASLPKWTVAMPHTMRRCRTAVPTARRPPLIRNGPRFPD
jgi:hypothetical protein